MGRKLNKNFLYYLPNFLAYLTILQSGVYRIWYLANIFRKKSSISTWFFLQVVILVLTMWCEYCKKNLLFFTDQLFQMHMVTFHGGTKEFIDKKKNEKKSKIKQSHNSQSALLKCKFCDFVTEKASDLKNHRHFKDKVVPLPKSTNRPSIPKSTGSFSKTQTPREKYEENRRKYSKKFASTGIFSNSSRSVPKNESREKHENAREYFKKSGSSISNSSSSVPKTEPREKRDGRTRKSAGYYSNSTGHSGLKFEKSAI